MHCRRRSKSYGDLTLKRTFDGYQNDTYARTTTALISKSNASLFPGRRRYSSCVEEPSKHTFSRIMLYEWVEHTKRDHK
jgi:hypothetical protein